LIQQPNAPCGLSRLSSPTSLRVSQYFNPQNATFPYTFSITSGTNIDIYIVNSGIHTAHADFGGRATFLAFFGDEVKGDDKDGHGTHVAGTTAGQFFGMAKKANLFAVKVLDDQDAGYPVQVIEIPQPGIRLAKRVTANANNFTLLNKLPTSLNNTGSITSPIWE
jgi:cerevisin